MSHIIQLRSDAAEPLRPSADPGSSASMTGVLEHPGLDVRTDAVYVVFTSVDETLAAARVASEFARAMAVPVTVIHFRTVPYALSVDKPDGLSPVEMESFVNHLEEAGLEMRVRVYLCRAPNRAIPMAFKKHSLIVMAGRRTWWRSRSERWRRALEAAGHFVVFVDTAQHKERSDA